MSDAVKFLSQSDLEALAAGDMSGVSSQGLTLLANSGRNPDREAGANAPGALRGFLSVMQGPTLGFGDEIAGVIGGGVDALKGKPGSFGELYRSNRDYARGAQAEEARVNPIFSAVTQGMAGAPLGMLGGVQKAAGMLPIMAQAAKTGAVFGGVGGVGNSQADSLGGMVMDAGKGAATGAALSAILPPVASAVGGATRNVASRVSDSAAANYAREKLAEALARDARGNVFAAGSSAPAGQVSARLGKLGEDAALVDAGGRNTNQLLDTLATLPGRTKENVFNFQRQRTAGAADRLRTAADDALGAGGQRLASTVEGLVTARETASRPLYERLRQTNLNPSQELSSIVQAAEDIGALSLARDIATAQRVPFTLDSATRQSGQWNAGQLDLVKQALDGILQGGKAIGKDGKVTPFGNAVQRLKSSLTTEMDALTTDPQTGKSLYEMARNAFAGPSALIDAAKAGKMAVTRDEATVQGMLSSLTTASERDAFKIGAFEALRAKLGTQGGQTQILNMWKEPTTREKLQLIFGDERSFREFAAATARESVFKRVQSVGTGSQTANRAAGMGDMDVSALSDVGSAVANAKAGNVLGVMGSARNAWGRVSTPQNVRDEMGAMLLSQGPAAQRNVSEIAALIDQINRKNGLLSSGSGYTGGLIGSNIGPARGLLGQ